MGASKKLIVLIIIILLGLFLRIFAMQGGHNYDFDSYLIVLKIIKKSQSVYAETTRYNYAPIWFNIIWVFYKIAGFDQYVFRILLVLFLSIVDILIFVILQSRFGLMKASFFLLNPLSIFITGFHNQFDNLAILIGLMGILLLEKNNQQQLGKWFFAGLIVVGISLATKHILFLFPLWLAIKQIKLTNKLLVILIPVSIFLLSFGPYIDTGLSGIIKNVFLYQSYNNNIFYNFFLPDFIQFIIPSKLFWLLTIFFCGVYFKNESLVDSFFYYLCIVVCVSPSIANQYLAIPLVYLAIHFNFLSVLYTLFGTIHLITDIDGLNFSVYSDSLFPDRILFYLILVLILSLSFIFSVYKKHLIKYSNNSLSLD